MPRRRSAVASSARVRGRTASCRRHISRARSASSARSTGRSASREPSPLVPPAALLPTARAAVDPRASGGTPLAVPDPPPAVLPAVPPPARDIPPAVPDTSPGVADALAIAPSARRCRGGDASHPRPVRPRRRPVICSSGTAESSGSAEQRGGSWLVEPDAVHEHRPSEVDRREVAAVGSVLRLPDAELLQDLLLDLGSDIGVAGQEVAGVLLALAQLVALVGVPGPGLADDALLDADVDQRTLTRDALAVEDVELGLLEGRRALVLHDLHAGPVADDLRTVLEALDTAYVQSDRGVELQRPATGGGLRTAEEDTHLLP